MEPPTGRVSRDSIAVARIPTACGPIHRRTVARGCVTHEHDGHGPTAIVRGILAQGNTARGYISRGQVSRGPIAYNYIARPRPWPWN